MEFIKILPNLGFVILAGVLATVVNNYNSVDSSRIIIEYEPIIQEEIDVYSPSEYLIVSVERC